MATKTDEKVMAMVEKELEKNPGMSSEELYNKAKSENSAIGKLSLRQFHARYPLQVKRRKSLSSSGGKKKKGKRAAPAAKKTSSRKRTPTAASRRSGASGDGQNREQVRSVLLKFASDLAAAEARKDLVGVLANVDRYVDQVVKAAK